MPVEKKVVKKTVGRKLPSSNEIEEFVKIKVRGAELAQSNID
jgi:hypothetical protein